VFHRGVLRTIDIDAEVERNYEIPYVYFGTFDGHAGAGCAIAAANELHQVQYFFSFIRRTMLILPFLETLMCRLSTRG